MNEKKGKQKKNKSRITPVDEAGILMIIAFLAIGCYHEAFSCALSIILTVMLVLQFRKTGKLLIHINLSTVFLTVMVLALGLSFFWAIDKNMAIIGFFKFLPAPIFALYYQQITGSGNLRGSTGGSERSGAAGRLTSGTETASSAGRPTSGAEEGSFSGRRSSSVETASSTGRPTSGAVADSSTGRMAAFPGALASDGLKNESRSAISSIWDYILTAGVIMIAVSLTGSRIPSCSDKFLINGRLAGTLEYPNTFAIVLLLGLVYLLAVKKTDIKNLAVSVILLGGIFGAGSRTVYVLLPIGLIFAVFAGKDKKNKEISAIILGILIIAAAGALIVSGRDAGNGVSDETVSETAGFFTMLLDRIGSVSLSESTFLGRLLYWKDAVPVILKHPLGLGYMGYFFYQGSFQTGVYSVIHCHNEFLQTFLNAGWLPGILMAGAVLSSVIHADAGWKRALLILLSLHMFMDFDLQFQAVYMLFVSLLDLDSGKRIVIAEGAVSGKALTEKGESYVVKSAGWIRKIGLMLISLLVIASSLYIGTGNAVYYIYGGNQEKYYPKYTIGEVVDLCNSQDKVTSGKLADEILSHNPYVVQALDYKAVEALENGDVDGMLKYKQRAIACARYSLAEYEAYIELLASCVNEYINMGDYTSASYCMSLLQGVPEMLSEVKDSTDELAWKISDKPELDLPEAYLAVCRGE